MGEAVQEKPKASVAQKVLNVVGVVLCVIFIPLIIANLTLIIKTYTSPEKLPSVFGISPVIVLSGSMEPEFAAGDMIFVQKVDTATLKVDDVICYMEGEDTAITHRIMEVQQQDGKTMYVTQGDANNVFDDTPVAAENVQGKYTGIHIPQLGNLAVFMQTPAGMIIFIVGPLLLFVLWDVIRRMLSGRKGSGKEQELQAELERLRAQVGAANGEQAAETENPSEPPHGTGE